MRSVETVSNPEKVKLDPISHTCFLRNNYKTNINVTLVQKIRYN